MKDFTFHNPTRIVFGIGAVAGIGDATRALGRRALLVYGRDAIKRIGLHSQIVGALQAAGVEMVEHPGVQPNPLLSHAEAGIALARSEAIDVVVAAGGGSVIDEAKAIAAGALVERPIWDMYTGAFTPERALPIVAVSTIPATASEMNGGTVITNDRTHQKFGRLLPALHPAVSFLDPALTVSLPREQSAFGAVDAISHLLEGYCTHDGGWVPIQDRYAEGIILSIIESTERILQDPNDLEARATMMWGATLAWNGLGPSGLGAFGLPNHMLAHPIGGLYDLAHGATLAIVIPAWVRHTMEQSPELARRIARLGQQTLGVPAGDPRATATRSIDALEAWFKKIGAPTRMGDAKIIDPDLRALTGQALELASLWGMEGTRREDVESVYRACV